MFNLKRKPKEIKIYDEVADYKPLPKWMGKLMEKLKRDGSLIMVSDDDVPCQCINILTGKPLSENCHICRKER